MMRFNKLGRHWAFLAPCLCMLLLSAGWPLLRTIFLSFTDATLDNLEDSAFVGLSNFVILFGDSQWWAAVWNTFLITGFSVPIETILGMILALALHKNFYGRWFLRTAVLIPWVIPTIVSARMWSWMLHDVYGVINEILLKIGLIHSSIAWTASHELSLLSIVVVDVWKTTPYMALLLLAGMQALPQECFEAAEVDGVSCWRRFWSITLPLIKPTIFVAVIFRTLDCIRIFDLVYILSSGNNSNDTMSVFARKHLVDYADVGLGSAAATAILFAIMLLSVFYIYAQKKHKMTENMK